MSASCNKTATGKLSLIGNEPFTYYLFYSDSGEELRLEGDREVLLPFQGARVKLVYIETDEKLIHPIVKVIEITEEK